MQSFKRVVLQRMKVVKKSKSKQAYAWENVPANLTMYKYFRKTCQRCDMRTSYSARSSQTYILPAASVVRSVVSVLTTGLHHAVVLAWNEECGYWNKTENKSSPKTCYKCSASAFSHKEMVGVL